MNHSVNEWSILFIYLKYSKNIRFLVKGTTIIDSDYMDIDKQIFFWPVIEGRQDLALLFWSRGKNQICKSKVFFLITTRYMLHCSRH